MVLPYGSAPMLLETRDKKGSFLKPYYQWVVSVFYKHREPFFFNISEAQEVDAQRWKYGVLLWFFFCLSVYFQFGIFFKLWNLMSVSVSGSLFFFPPEKPVITLGLITQRSLILFLRDCFLFCCDVLEGHYFLLLLCRYAWPKKA